MEIKIKENVKKISIKRPSELSKIFWDILECSDENDKKKEHFWSVGTNIRNEIQYIELVSLGSLNASLVHPREVFRFSILKQVAGVLFCHNHPSGDTTPSEDDIKLTKRLVSAGEILGIEVLDHIIISGSDYLSFKDKGLI